MIGETIGNYRIVEPLGHGGMGEVFLAKHHQVGTLAAIKFLQPHFSTNEAFVRRFFNEAIAAHKIAHAGIVKVFDSGYHTGRAYLVMEFLRGESLAARLQRVGRLALSEISDIGRQISSVLEATHKAGIVHRDLKPDNIFLVPDGELVSGERVKVLDFGIAKLTGTFGGATSTSVGMMGTSWYMAPEQWMNAAKVDWRADVYSLGCVAFQMACGRPPFPANSIGEACAQHLSTPPPRIQDLVPELPDELAALISQMLQKTPEDRPSSLREVAMIFSSLGTPKPAQIAPTPPIREVAAPDRSPQLRSGRMKQVIRAVISLSAVLCAIVALWLLVTRQGDAAVADASSATGTSDGSTEPVPEAGDAAEDAKVAVDAVDAADAADAVDAAVVLAARVMTAQETNKRAKLLLVQANEALAESAFDRALWLANASIALREKTEAYLIRATALQRLGRSKEALATMTVAERLGPRDPNVFELRGRLLWSLGRKKEGREQFEHFLELEPSTPRATRVRKLLEDS